MDIQTVAIQPFTDQRPGTSGLRKRTARFQEPHYLAAFVEAIFQTAPPQGTLVVGGDGRFFNAEALQTIISMASAHGCPRVVVGQGGILSTPAASHLIRSRGAMGGIILSASHNPGGPDGDFGIKFNGPNGAPSPEAVTDAIYAATTTLDAYRIVDAPPVDLGRIGETALGPMTVEVVDSTAAYADLMERLFDFEQIGALLRRPDFRILFDAMHAVTGPYGREVFERRLGIEGAVLHGEPLSDFGGGHPDPNPHNAAELVRRMSGPDAPQFGAASDGDGDRHMIVGPGFFVSPSDSLAILAANAEAAPGYRGRITGLARSMPTSGAVDRVAQALGVPCYETPTGWKFFGSLLDAGRITLCGEESAGAGSDHVREKDGLWAVLFWLNILAARGMGVQALVEDHWRRFGRNGYARLDYEGVETERAADLMARLRGRLPELAGASIRGRRVEAADEFAYTDPVDGSRTTGQGVRLMLEGGGRAVFRLSGTGTTGATLRVYVEQYTEDPAELRASAEALTGEVEAIAVEAADLGFFLDGAGPTGRV
jgi:phosphoglucomutase